MPPRGTLWHGGTDRRSRPSQDKTSLRGRCARHRRPPNSPKNCSRLRTVQFAICAVACRGAGNLRQKQSRGKGGEVSTQPCSKIWSKISMGVAAGVACCYAFPRCRAMNANASLSSFSSFPTGAHMKLSINFKHVESHKPIEVEVERHAAKLRKLLQSYSPDLVQLHGAFSKTPRTD